MIATSNFPLGRTAIARTAQQRLHPVDAHAALRRHSCGDWGDVTDEGWVRNDLSLESKDPLRSVYHDRNGTMFWIITDADRSSTRVLLPQEPVTESPIPRQFSAIAAGRPPGTNGSDEGRGTSRADGSVVSYPERCSLWGKAKYRGNCDGRIIKELIIRYRPKSVADPMEGSGTTRDLVNWMNERSEVQISYWGGDLRKGFNLLKQELPGFHDFVWIHPPYWNIIHYTDHIDDLSNLTDYDIFRDALRLCLVRCHAALNPGGHLAVLVGDVRRRGTYVPIVRDVLNLDGEIGQLRSVVIKVQHNCQSDAKSYATMEDPRIQHEYCVVFKRSNKAPVISRAA